MSGPYSVQVLHPVTDAPMALEEYGTLSATAQAMVTLPARFTDAELYDEHGELTVRIEGPAGRKLTASEGDRLQAMIPRARRIDTRRFRGRWLPRQKPATPHPTQRGDER